MAINEVNERLIKVFFFLNKMKVERTFFHCDLPLLFDWDSFAHQGAPELVKNIIRIATWSSRYVIKGLEINNNNKNRNYYVFILTFIIETKWITLCAGFMHNTKIRFLVSSGNQFMQVVNNTKRFYYEKWQVRTWIKGNNKRYAWRIINWDAYKNITVIASALKHAIGNNRDESCAPVFDYKFKHKTTIQEIRNLNSLLRVSHCNWVRLLFHCSNWPSTINGS